MTATEAWVTFVAVLAILPAIWHAAITVLQARSEKRSLSQGDLGDIGISAAVVMVVSGLLVIMYRIL